MEVKANRTSWDQEKFACRDAGFEVAVGVRRVGQRIGVFESELEAPVGDGVEDGARSKLRNDR